MPLVLDAAILEILHVKVLQVVLLASETKRSCIFLYVEFQLYARGI